RRSIALAENAALGGGQPADILAALKEGETDFGPPHVIPLDQLTGYSLEMFQGQPVVYDARPGGQWYAGLMLRGSDGQVMGSGGWYLHPRKFLETPFESVTRARLPSTRRMYGSYEPSRRPSFELPPPDGGRLASVRQPFDLGEARVEPLRGP